MGRRALAVGEVGHVKTERIGKSLFEARGRVGVIGDARGSVQVKGRASTAEGARMQLFDNARARAYVGTTVGINGNTKLIELAERTLNLLRSGQGVKKSLRPQTIDQYETVLGLIKGSNPLYADISNVRLANCTSTLVAGWLETVSANSPSTGKRCKAFLTHMFDVAIRHDLHLWSTNPARAASIATAERLEPVTLSDADIKEIRRRVLVWQTDTKRTDLWGIINMLVATGARPNEVLAIRWEDLDLAAGKVTIAGTIVRIKGEGLRYQPMPKTEAGFRVLTLPNWCVELISERRVNATSLWLFPNEDGGILDSQNIGKRWKDARGDEYAHVKLRSFRPALATRLERAYDSARVSAKQLGHSNTDVTRKHYIRQAHEAGDYTDVLDTLAPN